ncbi:uncharacterized protein EV422DRAFT_548520 [Fimicolochytrium jonesii]|uniref:uncharacterized protein n=1 Tax=Fimicolochytrium jonesii TaxID=1396493 RepID=UPI0022FF4486|nr:uncharacterized protein EV422DRAFT_548520 [Fimicolochytrium jonesii]KAI8815726.1 hypothetical protein EV422DRAFT_548520 [Fimicolochytrium jonesii]
MVSETASALLSAVFGALASILVSLAIERLGGLLGGCLASTPSTIIPATWGIWWSLVDGAAPSTRHHGLVKFQRATLVIPSGLVCTAVFLTGWRYFPVWLQRWRPTMRVGVMLAVVATATMGVWLIGAIAIVFVLRAVVKDDEVVPGDDFGDIMDVPLIPLLVGTISLVVVLATGLVLSWPSGAAPKGKNPVAVTTLLLRGLLAGVSIGVTIVIANVNEFAGGIASMLPIMFFTSMVSVWLAQGAAVTTGAIGPLVAGVSSVAAYAIAATFLYAKVGPYWGAVASWAVSVGGVTVPVYGYMVWRRRVWERRVKMGAGGLSEETLGAEVEVAAVRELAQDGVVVDVEDLKVGNDPSISK